MQTRHFRYLEKSGLLEKVRAEFDERYYLETYAGSIDPDVDPFLDFIEVGWKLGRNPSPNFNTRYYLWENGDVARAGVPPLTHYVANGRAEGRRPTLWTEEEARETRPRIVARARASLSLLPSDFVERHSTVQVTLLMLSQERLDQTVAAIRSIQDNVAIPFRLLVIDNGSSPETQRRLREMFGADDRITLVMREDNLGCAGGRNFGVEQIDTEFTMLVDNDLEVMPGAVEHLLHRVESEPHAAAATAMVVLPNGKVQLCGATYRRDGDVVVPLLHGSGLDFEEGFDVPGSCDWLAGGASLFRTELLRSVPFDEAMTYYEDNDWALRLPSDGREWTLHPVPESLIVQYSDPVKIEPGLPEEEGRRARLAIVGSLASLYDRHGLIHDDVFRLLPELGAYERPISVESAKLVLALLTKLGLDGVAEMWRSGQLNPIFGAIELDGRSRRLEADVQSAVGRTRSLESLRAVRAALRISRLGNSMLRPVRSAVGKLQVVWSQRRTMPVVPDLVSTILPVFNRADLAEQAIQSVLVQTYRPIEIVIVDDGSTDDTPNRMARLARRIPEVRYVRIPQSGRRIGRVREVGRKLAKGEFIQYLDSDDILHPEKFEMMVHALRSDPDSEIAFCQATRYALGDVPSRSPIWQTGGAIDDLLAATFRLLIWPTSTPLIRRSLSDRTGAWSDSRAWEDVEYWVRMARAGAVTHYCDARLVDIRDHSGPRASRSNAAEPSEIFAGLSALASHWRSAGVDLKSPQLGAFREELGRIIQRCLEDEDLETAQAVAALLREAGVEPPPGVPTPRPA